jgi:hypothetical protein
VDQDWRNQACAGGKLRSMLTLSLAMKPWILLAIFFNAIRRIEEALSTKTDIKGRNLFGSGRVVSRVSVDMVAEIFDYFSAQQFLGHSKIKNRYLRLHSF